MSASVVWFRQDLRLADNPALGAAVDRGGAVIPVFVWSPQEHADGAPGAASRWWLHESLARLDAELRALGSRLVIRCGPTAEALVRLAALANAGAVFWNRCHEPGAAAVEAGVARALAAAGVASRGFHAQTLFEPGTIRTRAGAPFQVFTPFWRACLAADPPAEPSPAPRAVPRPRRWPGSLPLERLELEPRVDWTQGIRAAWKPGEAGAHERLQSFLDDGRTRYPLARDRPDLPGVSRLSPHLHFGELSPRQVWHAVSERAARDRGPGSIRAAEAYLRQLGWREFAHHLLHHFPRTPSRPLRPEFGSFPWRTRPRFLAAWQRGRTGYPIVDAGMRELWHTGWMHNRVRMIVASFLVKDLLVSWRGGARWFWDTLVDADLANNTLGWQWAAGCGADAAPFFRIFHPVLQGTKFDPEGAYVRRWIPELRRMPARYIHRPWAAPPDVLAAAGVTPGKDYPAPIVDHALARERALAAFRQMRGRRGGRTRR